MKQLTLILFLTLSVSRADTNATVELPNKPAMEAEQNVSVPLADLNTTAACPPVALEEQYDGYAYMMFGTENIIYQEIGSARPIDSSVSATNLVQMSGGLTKVNDRFDFSIDSVATLLSQKATEQWSANKDFYNEVDGTTYLVKKDSLLQENSFDIVGSKLKILLHYKQTQNFRYVFGPAYSLDTFKRYNWVAKHPVITDDSAVREERYASLHAHAGVSYESFTAAVRGLRYNLRATYGIPLWQETTNTSERYQDVVFTDYDGYNVDLDAFAGYTVMDGVEVGLCASYALQHRKGGVTDVTYAGETLGVEWPENTLQYFRMGMMFVWKFRE